MGLSSDFAVYHALRADGASNEKIARTLNRSMEWVELQVELEGEKTRREARQAQERQVKAAERQAAFAAAQERGRLSRAAAIAARSEVGQEKPAPVPGGIGRGVVERSFRTAYGYGAAVAIDDRLVFAETFGVRYAPGTRVTPSPTVFCLVVEPTEEKAAA